MAVWRAIAVTVGAALTFIGVRFWLQPEQAAWFFGVGRGAYPTALHDVIAVRDIWLGLMAIAFGLLREWRALVVWLGLGTLVCFADATIAAASGARPFSIAFHIGSGVLMAALSALAWQRLRRTGS